MFEKCVDRAIFGRELYLYIEFIDITLRSLKS